MNIIFLFVAAGATICALKNKIGLLAVLYLFMEKRHCTPPTDEELKECSVYVVKRLLRLTK